MDNKLKQDFTRRLSQCNRGEMVVIIYDIFFEYTGEAKKAHEAGSREEMKESIRKAQRVLDELVHSLNFSYELSGNLFALYVYCKRQLARAMYENRQDGLCEAENVMGRLRSSFEVAAKQDHSAPLMRNTQQVYAGMTYAPGALNESYIEPDNRRGFLV
jgi:flagellar protein FliS